VDAELLLELDREDLIHLGIVKLQDVKSVLRWIANCYDDDEDSSDENDSIIVASLQQIPRSSQCQSCCCCGFSIAQASSSSFLV
jgi:hypothetical protein